MVKVRMFWTGKLMMVASLAAFISCAVAQESQPLTVHKVTKNVYWAEGGTGKPVGNSGFVIGDNGVIVIDAKTTADSGRAILEEIAKITSKPVTHVILTHSNGDHVNGIAAFPTGLTIIAQENCEKEMKAAIAQGGRNVPPANRLPTHLVKNKEVLTIHGVKIQLLHWAPAHTSGDLVVYLPEQRVAFTGDLTAMNHPEPSLHAELKGSARGWIESAKGIAALDADTFIPGHLGLQTKAEVQGRLKSSEAQWTRVASMIKEGKSWEEIKKTQAEDKSLSATGRPSFTEIAYQELTKK